MNVSVPTALALTSILTVVAWLIRPEGIGAAVMLVIKAILTSSMDAKVIEFCSDDRTGFYAGNQTKYINTSVSSSNPN
jgi:hypothetical protein